MDNRTTFRHSIELSKFLQLPIRKIDRRLLGARSARCTKVLNNKKNSPFWNIGHTKTTPYCLPKVCSSLVHIRAQFYLVSLYFLNSFTEQDDPSLLSPVRITFIIFPNLFLIVNPVFLVQNLTKLLLVLKSCDSFQPIIIVHLVTRGFDRRCQLVLAKVQQKQKCKSSPAQSWSRS